MKPADALRDADVRQAVTWSLRRVAEAARDHCLTVSDELVTLADMAEGGHLTFDQLVRKLDEADRAFRRAQGVEWPPSEADGAFHICMLTIASLPARIDESVQLIATMVRQGRPCTRLDVLLASEGAPLDEAVAAHEAICVDD